VQIAPYQLTDFPVHEDLEPLRPVPVPTMTANLKVQ